MTCRLETHAGFGLLTRQWKGGPPLTVSVTPCLAVSPALAGSSRAATHPAATARSASALLIPGSLVAGCLRYSVPRSGEMSEELVKLVEKGYEAWNSGDRKWVL